MSPYELAVTTEELLSELFTFQLYLRNKLLWFKKKKKSWMVIISSVFLNHSGQTSVCSLITDGQVNTKKKKKKLKMIV